MFIEEVEIFNILGCESVHLCFGDTLRRPVYVVKSDSNSEINMRGILTLAIQLICSAKYATVDSLVNPLFENIQEGGVRLKFILPLLPGRHSSQAIGILFEAVTSDDGTCTSGSDGGSEMSPTNAMDTEQRTNVCDDTNSSDERGPLLSTSRAVLERVQHIKPRTCWRRQSELVDENIKKFLLIDAYRDFRKDPENIYFSINNGPIERSTLAAFHGRFYVCFDYMLPQLENLHNYFFGDWLELLTADLNNKWNRREQLYDPFERFVNLFLKYGYPEQHILPQIARARLLINESVDVLKKSYALKILRDARGIFEFITAGEFTVWFYVPYYGRYADVIKDVMVEDLSFEFMATYIQDNSKPRLKQLWTEANNAIKDFLLISFQLALAFHCKQQILFLENFDEISKYQSLQVASVGYFQSLGFGQNHWCSKNYLQRIIDVCINSGITAVIEFPGGTPLHPVNAYLIKIFQISNSNPPVLDMKIINGEQYSFDYFLDCIKNGLQRTNC